jgi:hypothetical protein
MKPLRAYLVLALVGLSAYTLAVGLEHGWNLLPVFFADIAKISWPGQFNVDFMGFLGLSAIWVAWRHGFTWRGIALGVVAFFGGMMFLAAYMLWACSRAGDDPGVLLLGEERARRRA